MRHLTLPSPPSPYTAYSFVTSAQDLHGCPIRPKSYALVEGVWKPYEYKLGKPGRVEDSQVYFFERIKQRIVDLDIGNIGLRRYSPTDPEELEITDRGGISIKVPLDLASCQC